MQRVQLPVQRVGLGREQAQGGEPGGRAKQPGLRELELLLGLGDV